MAKILFMALCLIVFPGAYSYAQTPVIYVTVAGSGNNDGSSWSNAKNGTQLAAVLRNMAEHSAVWIAKGVYKPHPSSRDSSFVIKSNTRVIGGFSGNETMLSQRNWVANTTILSGDIGVVGDISDNSKHVVFIENAGDSTILDGLTITLGNASGQYADPPMERIGGGIVNFTNANPGLSGISKPKIYNCTIKKNYAFEAGGGYCEYNFGTSSSYFYNCSFDSNFCANNGGAYSLYLLVGGNASPLFESTRFVNNILDTGSTVLNSQGGALSLAKYGSTAAYTTPVTLNNCLFERNGARAGGAIASGKGFEFIINNTTFKKNFARSASVIYASDNDYRINHCVIDSNESVGNTLFFSTGVHNYIAVHTKKFITNSSFKDNTGNNLIDIQAGSTLASQIPSDTTYFTNCLFFNNGLYGQIRAQAYPGGRTNTFMNNVTVYDDEQHVFQKAWDRQVTNIGMNASQVVGPGSANMFINNSIIWYPLLLAGDRSIKSLIEGPTGSSGGMESLTVKHTIFRSGSGNWPLQAGTDAGGNLINANPDFIDTSGNFRLNCGSPAVNSGLNNLYPVSISNNDIDGASRIYNNVIDRGAYEQQATEVIIQPEIIISGNNLVMNINANYSILNASWNLGDGTTGSGLHIDHNYLANGTYNVCLNVLTACGSKDTCFQVTIASTSTGYPNDKEGDWINIYPNPSQGITWITSSTDLPFVAQLFEPSGKVVREWTITSNKAAIGLEKIPAGIYFLRLIKEGRTFRTFKMLKQ